MTRTIILAAGLAMFLGAPLVLLGYIVVHVVPVLIGLRG